MFVGLDNKKGCYIKLLDSNNLNVSNFSIALGYDIQDIQVSTDYIALSAGPHLTENVQGWWAFSFPTWSLEAGATARSQLHSLCESGA